MSSVASDLRGQRFERLVALKPTDKRAGGCVVWRCQCDCGTICFVTSYRLTGGRTKSCGCLKKDSQGAFGKHRTLPLGIASRNALLHKHKAGARSRGLAWGLSDEQALDFFGQDCHYCGAPPSNIHSRPDLNGDFVYSGIDRLDNALGYVEGNCVPCCKRCNLAKNNMPLKEFKAWLTRAYKQTIINGR